MWIYLISIILCTLFAMLSKKNIKINGKEISSFCEKIFFIIFCFFSLFIIGLRADDVGIDTLNYKAIFVTHKNMSMSYLLHLDLFKNQIGFSFINILFNKLNLSWNMYVFFMAILFVLPVFILIYKKSNNVFCSIVYFIILGWLTYPMSAIRQAAAIGITIIAFLFEDENKNFKCLFLIFIAQTIHYSAIISLLYFIARKIPLNKKNVSLWLFIGLLVTIICSGLFRSIMFKMFLLLGSIYKNDDNTGGLLMEVMLVVTLLIGAFFSNDKTDNKYWQYYKAVFLTALLLPIIRTHPALFRIYQYFSIYLIIFFPLLINEIRDHKIKIIGNVGYFTVFTFLFIKQIIEVSSKLLPYKFFWNN